MNNADRTDGQNSEALLTVKEVANLLRLPASWVYERTRKRGLERIPGFRLGKYWRFREADVLAWLDRQRSGTAPRA
jgi:excisionase family DNA binding protein